MPVRKSMYRKGGSRKRTVRKVGGRRKRTVHRRMRGRGWGSFLTSGLGKLGGVSGLLNGLGGVASIGSGIAGMVASNHQQQAIDEERDRQKQMWEMMKRQNGMS